MKSLLGRLGVILIGLAIFGYAEVWGADWKLYNVNDNYKGYYDAQSIPRPSKNIVRVWVKWDVTEKGVLDWGKRKNDRKKYENLNHMKVLYEIDCVEKKSRRLSGTEYDNKGGMIDSDSSPSKWEFIIPESMTEGLYEEVCK
jgi:hypothetical protein